MQNNNTTINQLHSQKQIQIQSSNSSKKHIQKQIVYSPLKLFKFNRSSKKKQIIYPSSSSLNSSCIQFYHQKQSPYLNKKNTQVYSIDQSLIEKLVHQKIIPYVTTHFSLDHNCSRQKQSQSYFTYQKNKIHIVSSKVIFKIITILAIKKLCYSLFTIYKTNRIFEALSLVIKRKSFYLIKVSNKKQNQINKCFVNLHLLFFKKKIINAASFIQKLKFITYQNKLRKRHYAINTINRIILRDQILFMRQFFNLIKIKVNNNSNLIQTVKKKYRKQNFIQKEKSNHLRQHNTNLNKYQSSQILLEDFPNRQLIYKNIQFTKQKQKIYTKIKINRQINS